MKLLNNTLTFFTLLLVISSAYQAQASQSPPQEKSCFFDNHYFCWELTLNLLAPMADYYKGKMINYAGESGAAAIELKPYDGRISISSDYGTSFHYDLKWDPSKLPPSGSGAWANSNGIGQGVVTSFISIPCPCRSTIPPSNTSRPGE